MLNGDSGMTNEPSSVEFTLNSIPSLSLKNVKSYSFGSLNLMSDILLIRGKWATPTLSKPMSDAYNKLLEISNQVIEFDDSLAEDVDIGLKLKTMLPRTDRDKDIANICHTIIHDANKEAGSFITTALNCYIIYAKNIKTLLEDSLKQTRSELIINWDELKRYAEHDVKPMCVAVYKKIYLFVSLMQNFPVEGDK